MNDLKDYNAAIREYKAVVKLLPTTAQAQDSQYIISYIYGSVIENKKQATLTMEHAILTYTRRKLQAFGTVLAYQGFYNLLKIFAYSLFKQLCNCLKREGGVWV